MKKIWLLFISALCILTLFGCGKNLNSSTKNKLTKAIDEKIAENMEKYTDTWEDAYGFSLSDFSYKIDDIQYWEDFDTKAVATISINISTDDEEKLTYGWTSPQAYADNIVVVAFNSLFPIEGIKSDNITVHTFGSVGESYPHLNISINDNLVYDVEAFRVADEEFIKLHMSDNDKNGIICKSCGNTYDKSSDHAKKIKSSGLCNNCYNWFKAAKKAVDEAPLN